jgi:hypothetical protein
LTVPEQPLATVIVSRPTFAELAAALARAGFSNTLDESGDILCGELRIHADQDAPQRERLAAALADASQPHIDPEIIYQDEHVTIEHRCHHGEVHLIERRVGCDPHIVILPRQSLHLVAGELIECMAPPVTSASVPQPL